MPKHDQYRSELVLTLEDTERNLQVSNEDKRIHFQLVSAGYSVIHSNKDAPDKILEVKTAIENRRESNYRARFYLTHMARVYFTMGLYLQKSGGSRESAENYRQARQLLSQENDTFKVVETYLKFAKFLSFAGYRDSAVEYLTEALFLLCDTKLPDLDYTPDDYIAQVYLPFKEGYYDLTLGRTQLMLGSIYMLMAEQELALRHLYEAGVCFEKIESYVYLCYTKALIAEVYLGIGKFEKAQEYLEQARSSASRTEHICTALSVALNEAKILFAHNEYTKAEQCCDEIIEECTKNNIADYIKEAYRVKGDIFVATKRLEEAGAMYQLCLTEYERNPINGPLEGPHLGLSAICRLKGDYREAIRHGARALEIAQDTGDRRKVYRCHEALYLSYRALGEVEKAFQHLDLFHTAKASLLSLEKGERIAALELNRRLQEARVEARRQAILREQAEKDLQKREDELSQLTLTLEHKNALLAQRNGADNGYADTVGTQARNGMHSPIGKAVNNHSGLDDFSNRVERMYPEVCRQLMEAAPSLTVTELRVCALTKAQLSVKETADTLCVSEGAVLKTRWRIRRKLGLQRSQSLVQFLAAL